MYNLKEKFWNFNKIALDFIKDNSKVLCINLPKEDVENLKINNAKIDETLEKEQFNLILNRNSSYNIKNIAEQLVKGGHFLTEQKGSEDCEYSGIRTDFNLENEYLAFTNNNFKVVRYSQIYFEKEQNKYHRFYILAKKL